MAQVDMREFHSQALIRELQHQLKVARSQTSHLHPTLFYIGTASVLMWASGLFYNGIPFETLQAFPAVVGLACLAAGYHFRAIAHQQQERERRLSVLLEKAGVKPTL